MHWGEAAKVCPSQCPNELLYFLIGASLTRDCVIQTKHLLETYNYNYNYIFVKLNKFSIVYLHEETTFPCPV